MYFTSLDEGISSWLGLWVLSLFRQQPLALRGLSKKGFPPTPRGDESEGASDLCIGSEEAAGVILLDLISGT